MTSTFAARLQIENDGTHHPQDTHGRKRVPCVPYDHNGTHGTRPGRVLAGRAGRVLAGWLAVCWLASRVLAGRVLAHTTHGPGAARPARPCALVLRPGSAEAGGRGPSG